MNRKRTQRLCRAEGLPRPAPCSRKRRRPEPGQALFRTQHRNHVWGLAFQFDETADHRRLKLLNVVDEFTREALAMRVGRNCNADAVVAVLEAPVAQRGAPAACGWTTGPSSWPGRSGTGAGCRAPGTVYIEPFVESFNGRARHELLNVEDFASVLEAQVVCRGMADRVQHLPAPLRLAGLTPAEFARKWTTKPTSTPVTDGPVGGDPSPLHGKVSGNI